MAVLSLTFAGYLSNIPQKSRTGELLYATGFPNEKYLCHFFKKKGALFQEESYMPRIFMSSSLNLHTFHLIHIVFWCQIFFRKHGKSTPNDRKDHHVLVVDVVIMTSQCRCTRALSQSHVAKHDNHVPVAPLIGSGLGVMSMNWVSCNGCRMAKSNRQNIKIIFKLRPSIHNRIANLFMEAWRYEVGTILLETVPPFS